MSTCQHRRSFLKFALAASAASALRLHAEQVSATLRLGASAGFPSVPKSFVGLSYENMQLEDPSFFSPANVSLIQQFRAIATRGVLRLGGNTSEFGWWKTSSLQAPPQREDAPWKATGEPTSTTRFAITPQAVDNLSGFLSATGWSCIYGLNLGYGTPEVDLPEAVYVSQKLGPRLEYFQVGNEVDLFKGHLRDPATWNAKRYLEQWLVIARAVQKRLPQARFGMPDVASNVGWLRELSECWAAVPDKPNVVSLSHHYYWSGPPSNPMANITNLLQPDKRVAGNAQVAQTAARHFGPTVQWRMTEGNTVYRGGKNGVSDVFAASLWSADYLLHLMSLGYAGVNLHGGSGHAQAVSVGGTFAGEALMSDSSLPHPKPFYTPIANEGTLAGAGVNGVLSDTYVLEPVAVGMQFASSFAGATMLAVDFAPDNVNASAYAAKTPTGDTLIAVINKDKSNPLRLLLTAIREVTVLSADTLASTTARLERRAPTANEVKGRLEVPPHTAMLIKI